MNAIVYDLEIVKAVPDKNGQRLEGVEYCEGWHDHKNMGISVIGCYDYAADRYRTFLKDNFDEFVALARSRDLMVSFNGIGFDNKVLDACGLASAVTRHAEQYYDILRELWIADGLGPEFSYPTHIGYGLNEVATSNFNVKKTGHGAAAPVQWQRGEYGKVIDYCLEDVRLTKRCFDRIRHGGGLRSPKDASRFLEIRKP
jgi:RNase_H superfamily